MTLCLGHVVLKYLANCYYVAYPEGYSGWDEPLSWWTQESRLPSSVWVGIIQSVEWLNRTGGQSNIQVVMLWFSWDIDLLFTHRDIHHGLPLISSLQVLLWNRLVSGQQVEIVEWLGFCNKKSQFFSLIHTHKNAHTHTHTLKNVHEEIELKFKFILLHKTFFGNSCMIFHNTYSLLSLLF